MKSTCLESLSVPARLYVTPTLALSAGLEWDLDEATSRHVQVLRMQPGEVVQVFNGQGGQWLAEVLAMGRKVVRLKALSHEAVERELPRAVTLALGMPANDRMDGIVEKATELGVTCIQPLMCERSVLRLDGDRAAKKVAHWQGVAIAAAEQSGRTHVPTIQAVMPFGKWLDQFKVTDTDCGVLSLTGAKPIRPWAQAQTDQTRAVCFLSGPEGGLSPAEESAALSAGWQAVSLGRRVLRADTAPLMALGVMASMWESTGEA